MDGKVKTGNNSAHFAGGSSVQYVPHHRHYLQISQPKIYLIMFRVKLLKMRTYLFLNVTLLWNIYKVEWRKILDLLVVYNIDVNVYQYKWILHRVWRRTIIMWLPFPTAPAPADPTELLHYPGTTIHLGYVKHTNIMFYLFCIYIKDLGIINETVMSNIIRKRNLEEFLILVKIISIFYVLYVI